MAADQTTVTKRVIEILDACLPRTFTATVSPTVLKRNTAVVTQAIREAAMMIARAVISNPNHAHRNLYVSGTPTSLTHQAELPDMSSEMDLIEIQLYNGGAWTTGTPRTIQQIESYRLNPNNLYSDTAHTTQDSPLAGYYAIQNGRVYFTGYAARGYFPLIDRSTVAGLVADEYEGTQVALGVSLCKKLGDDLESVAAYYADIGNRDLAAISNMGVLSPMPTVEQAKAARGDN